MKNQLIVKKKRQKRAKKIHSMPDKEFDALLIDAILLNIDNKRALQMFVKNNKPFIEKMKKLVDPKRIFNEARNELKKKTMTR